MSKVVYDLECLKNFFSYADINIDTNQKYVFYIHPSNDSKKEKEEFLKYLDSLSLMIGYNNLYYDYPLLEFILRNRINFLKESSEKIVNILYEHSQAIINDTISKNKKTNSYKPIIPQLDLYKIWHFDNKNKRMSLKDVQVSIRYHNIQDMPFKHYDELSEKNIPDIIKYNFNDVDSTLQFYNLTIGNTSHPLYKGKNKLQMRKDLGEIYGLNLLNSNDASIGEGIVLNEYCKATGKNKKEVKELRTFRPNIPLKDCIFPYIKFRSDKLNSFLDHLKTITLTKDTKFKFNVVYKGFKYDYGKGGIHGCIKSGIYKSDDEYIIIDADVASLYPNIAIKNELYPKQLGKEFINVNKSIVDKRLKAKADLKTDNPDKRSGPLAEGLKLAANSIYGKSNSEYSFLYDPKYTFTTTVNGQLMLTMLTEEIVDLLTNVTVLQVNTDGITVKIKRTEIDKFYEICKNWEKLTKLTLEYVNYSKMIIRDVNSYISVKENGSLKIVGAFDFDKEIHKNLSFRIVPYAAVQKLVYDIPVEETVRSTQDIYDFCGRYKCRTWEGWKAEYYKYHKGLIDKINLEKTTRYYASTALNKLYKVKEEAGIVKKEIIESTTGVMLFNTYKHENHFNNYNVNFKYYEVEANKLINAVILNANQLSLF